MLGFCQEEGGEGSRERLLHQGGHVFMWTSGRGNSSLESLDCYCRFAVFHVLKPHNFSDET